MDGIVGNARFGSSDASDAAFVAFQKYSVARSKNIFRTTGSRMVLAIATASSARLRQYSAFGAQPISGSVARRTDSRSTRGREVASSSSAVAHIARRVPIGGNASDPAGPGDGRHIEPRASEIFSCK